MIHYLSGKFNIKELWSEKSKQKNSAVFVIQNSLRDHSVKCMTTVLYTQPECYIGDRSAILR